MESNLNFDTKQFLTNVLDNIREDINWAYPLNHLNEGRAHTTLIKIEGQIKTIQQMLKALQPTEGVKDAQQQD